MSSYKHSSFTCASCALTTVKLLSLATSNQCRRKMKTKMEIRPLSRKYQRINKIIPARDTLVLIAISWWAGFQQWSTGKNKSGKFYCKCLGEIFSLVKMFLVEIFPLCGILTMQCVYHRLKIWCGCSGKCHCSQISLSHTIPGYEYCSVLITNIAITQ